MLRRRGVNLLRRKGVNFSVFSNREAKNSQAEVDYVIQKQDRIVPIEVKAGTKGSMQSMYLFMEEKKSRYGVRLSLENFAEFDKVRVIPLYAASNIYSLQDSAD